MLQAHHLHVVRVDEPLKEGLIDVPSLGQSARHFGNLCRKEIQLRHTLDLSKERSVLHEADVARVEHILEEAFLSGSEFHADLAQGFVEAVFFELAEILRVEALENRAYCERVVLRALQPRLERANEFLNVCDLLLLAKGVCERYGSANILESAELFVVDNDWLQLALKDHIFVLKVFNSYEELLVGEATLVARFQAGEGSLQISQIYLEFFSLSCLSSKLLIGEHLCPSEFFFLTNQFLNLV